MLNKNTKKQTVRFLGIVCGLSVAFAAGALLNTSTVSMMEAFAEENIAIEAPVNELNVSMSETKYKLSQDGEYLLLATAFKADEVLADTTGNYIIGYEVNGVDTFANYGKKYYESITLKTTEEQTVTQSVTDIFGAEYAGYYLNVYEVANYSLEMDYTFQAFVKQITPVEDTYTVDKVSYATKYTKPAIYKPTTDQFYSFENVQERADIKANMSKYFSISNGGEAAISEKDENAASGSYSLKFTGVGKWFHEISFKGIRANIAEVKENSLYADYDLLSFKLYVADAKWQIGDGANETAFGIAQATAYANGGENEWVEIVVPVSAMESDGFDIYVTATTTIYIDDIRLTKKLTYPEGGYDFEGAATVEGFEIMMKSAGNPFASASISTDYAHTGTQSLKFSGTGTNGNMVGDNGEMYFAPTVLVEEILSDETKYADYKVSFWVYVAENVDNKARWRNYYYDANLAYDATMTGTYLKSYDTNKWVELVVSATYLAKWPYIQVMGLDNGSYKAYTVYIDDMKLVAPAQVEEPEVTDDGMIYNFENQAVPALTLSAVSASVSVDKAYEGTYALKLAGAGLDQRMKLDEVVQLANNPESAQYTHVSMMVYAESATAGSIRIVGFDANGGYGGVAADKMRYYLANEWTEVIFTMEEFKTYNTFQLLGRNAASTANVALTNVYIDNVKFVTNSLTINNGVAYDFENGKILNMTNCGGTKITNEQAYSGTHSLKATAGASNFCLNLEDLVNWLNQAGNESYTTVTLRIKADPATVSQIRVLPTNTVGGGYKVNDAYAFGYYAPTSDWLLVTIDAAALRQGFSCLQFLNTANKALGTIYIDDISVS